MVPATVLVGGFVRGIWKAELKRGKATLVIEPFEPLAKEDRDALANEGAGLLAFAAADVETRDIEFGAVR